MGKRPLSDTAIVSEHTHDIYWALFEDMCTLVGDLKTFDMLFHEKSRPRSEIFVEKLPKTREWIFHLLQLRVQLWIPRMLDPGESYGSANATFEALADSIDDDANELEKKNDPISVQSSGKLRDFAQWLRDRLGSKRKKLVEPTGLRALADPIIQARHKRVAHRDHEVAVGNHVLPGITPALLRELIEKEFALILDQYLDVAEGAFIEHTQLLGDDEVASELLAHLEHGRGA